MVKKYLVVFFVVILAFVVSCTPVQQAAPTAPAAPKAEVNVNPSAATPTTQQPSQDISAEVEGLLNKSKTRVKSIYYKYKGPETGNDFYDFYVKDTKIKYKPALEIKTLDTADSYDTIFIDKTARTAASYCVATYCAYKGKKQDLSYDDAYILTIFDWVSDLTEANKVGEEVIDDRNTWKIETNKGILWIDTFYGIPLKAESGGKTYRFQQISANSIADADVTPSALQMLTSQIFRILQI